MFLSVVMPIYNVSPYLRQALDSLLAQRFTDFEAILVDDGSNDGSEQICNEYTEKDRRYVVLHQKNQGIVAARRNGLSIARGDYVGFLDGDDWFEPDMYQKMCAAIRDNDVDIAICDYFENFPHKIKRRSFPFESTLYQGQRYIENVIEPMICTSDRRRFTSIYTLWNAVIRRDSAINAYRDIPDALKLGEDTAAMLSCLASANSLFYLNEPLVHYRRMRSGSMTTRPDNRLQDRSLFIKHLRTTLSEHLPSCDESRLNSYYIDLLMYDMGNADKENRQFILQDREVQEALHREWRAPLPWSWKRKVARTLLAAKLANIKTAK